MEAFCNTHSDFHMEKTVSYNNIYEKYVNCFRKHVE